MCCVDWWLFSRPDLRYVYPIPTKVWDVYSYGFHKSLVCRECSKREEERKHRSVTILAEKANDEPFLHFTT